MPLPCITVSTVKGRKRNERETAENGAKEAGNNGEYHAPEARQKRNALLSASSPVRARFFAKYLLSISKVNPAGRANARFRASLLSIDCEMTGRKGGRTRKGAQRGKIAGHEWKGNRRRPGSVKEKVKSRDGYIHVYTPFYVPFLPTCWDPVAGVRQS